MWYGGYIGDTLMAREKEFDEMEALKAASKVFCEKGFEATSLHDLEQAMGLNRTSIYNAFGNKRSIFNQILVQFVECGRQRWQELLTGSDTAREGIENLLNAVVDMNFGPNPQSCLISLSLMEKSQHDGACQELMEQAMHALKKLIQKRLETAQKEGEFGQAFDPRGVAAAITTLFSGFMVMGKANFPKATMRKAVQASLSLLDTD